MPAAGDVVVPVLEDVILSAAPASSSQAFLLCHPELSCFVIPSFPALSSRAQRGI
jgi:hypothetical protein